MITKRYLFVCFCFWLRYISHVGNDIGEWMNGCWSITTIDNIFMYWTFVKYTHTKNILISILTKENQSFFCYLVELENWSFESNLEKIFFKLQKILFVCRNKQTNCFQTNERGVYENNIFSTKKKITTFFET